MARDRAPTEYVPIRCVVEAVTMKAALITDERGNECWVPKSQIQGGVNKQSKLIHVAEWIVERNGLHISDDQIGDNEAPIDMVDDEYEGGYNDTEGYTPAPWNPSDEDEIPF